MTSSSRTPYDEFHYPDHVFEYTHPNHLAALGKVYGMDPAPAARCRMLELGCAAGGNIIPTAYQHPDSAFVGVDLSQEAVERGRQRIAAMGLSNIRLLHCDIADVDESLGQFDYIVTHGVYSWVPPEVRDRIMAILKAQLRPQGIGYVSYNAQPFSHLRDMARDIMLYHTRDITDRAKKIGQARSIMKFISESSQESTLHGKIMRSQYERVAHMSDEILFHDDLNAGAKAFLLHEVAAHGAAHGLQYLSDAIFTRRNLARYSEETRATLQKFPDSEFMARDQYQDFVDGHGFRRTLLCHDDILLERKIAPNFIDGFYLLAHIEPVGTAWRLGEESPMQFKSSEQSELTATEPLLKSALLCLSKAWPGAMTLVQLLSEARALIEPDYQVTTSDEEDLVAMITALVHSGEVIFLHAPPNLTTSITERPEVSLVARMQAEYGPGVTSLLHQRVRLTDERARRFARLLDGTRTHQEIVADMAEIIAETDEAAGTSDDSATQASDSVEVNTKRALATLSKLGLLIR